jgi:hypothetical protein
MEDSSSLNMFSELSLEAIEVVRELQKKYNRNVYPYSCANNRGKQWKFEEDAMIVHLVSIHGTCAWASITAILNDRWPECNY